MDEQGFSNWFWMMFGFIIAAYSIAISYSVGWRRGYNARKRLDHMETYGGWPPLARPIMPPPPPPKDWPPIYTDENGTQFDIRGYVVGTKDNPWGIR